MSDRCCSRATASCRSTTMSGSTSPEIPDYGTPITIRHLLTPHERPARPVGVDRAGRAGVRGRSASPRPTCCDIVPRQKRAQLHARRRNTSTATPGSRSLAVIVKRVSGQSLREFAAERIFKPLGMTRTHFHDDHTMIVPAARRPTVPRRRRLARQLPNFDTYGATSLFTTAGDLLKWEANFDKPAVGDRALFAQMRTPARLTNGDTGSTAWRRRRSIPRQRRCRTTAPTPDTELVGRFPEHGVSVAVLCNAASANPTALARDVAGVVLQGVLAPPAPPARALSALTSARKLARIARVYADAMTGAPTFLTLRHDTLILGRTAGPALIPLSESRFRISGQPTELPSSRILPVASSCCERCNGLRGSRSPSSVNRRRSRRRRPSSAMPAPTTVKSSARHMRYR